MALSPEEKQKLLVLLTLMTGGAGGRSALNAIQPIIAIIEKQKAEEKARKDAKRAQMNGIAGQVGGTVGTLGGMYLVGKALAPAAATTGATAATGAGAATGATAATGAGAATGATAGSTVATPTLLSVGPASGGAAAGTGTAAGAASGEAAAGSSLGSAGSIALPVAAVVAALSNAWETGGKDILRGRGDRADWTNQLFNASVGAVPNLGLRLLGKRSIGAMMKSGKSDAQQLRDSFRGDLREAGIAQKMDGSDYVTLADGSKFNVGLDGKTKYNNVGKNIDGNMTRNAWDVDFSNPLAKLAADKLDPIIRNQYAEQKGGVHPEQFTGMLVNAVTSNAKSDADVDANIKALLGNKLDGLSANRSAPTVQLKPAVNTSPTPATTAAMFGTPKPTPQVTPRPMAPLPNVQGNEEGTGLLKLVKQIVAKGAR